jgi:hypothetical protein
MIQSTAGVLERHAVPPDVWKRVAAGIQAEPRRRVWSPFALRQQGGLLDAGWRRLAIAAVTLVVVGSGAWLAWRQVSQPTIQVAATPPATATPDDDSEAEAMGSVESRLKLAEAHYADTINGLDAIRKAEASTLDPETAEVVQANLMVIDDAIGESRAALQSEPSSAIAQDSLFGALQSKVSLLQDTIALINEMRKGDPEGTARIASGMNP